MVKNNEKLLQYNLIRRKKRYSLYKIIVEIKINIIFMRCLAFSRVFWNRRIFLLLRPFSKGEELDDSNVSILFLLLAIMDDILFLLLTVGRL